MICPKCGAEMVVRTARRGPRTGKNFYGCTNYPRCKCIVNIEEDSDQDSRNSSGGKQSNIYSDIPVEFKARSGIENGEIRVFDTLALPQKLLFQINENEKKRHSYLRHSKWRLDYPHIISFNMDSNLSHLVSVANKILTRGRLTITSPWLEKKLEGLFAPGDLAKTNFEPERYSAVVKDVRESGIQFDGNGTEKLFYENVLGEYFGDGYKSKVIPQVYLETLTEINGDSQEHTDARVDFYVNDNGKEYIFELDGTEHQEHKSRDKTRDELIKDAGYTVHRVPNETVAKAVANEVKENSPLYGFVNNPKDIDAAAEINADEKYIAAIKVAHQLQLTILEIIALDFHESEKLNIWMDNKSLKWKSADMKKIVKWAWEDLERLLKNLAKLYGVEIDFDSLEIDFYRGENDGYVITYNDALKSNCPKFMVRDFLFERSIRCFQRPSGDINIKTTEKELLEYFLKYIFRKESFWEGQHEAIERALYGMDSIVLLPTGSGKSIAFQIASMLRPGVTIVIDPIIALINDQIDNLTAMGMDRVVGITSEIENYTKRSRIIDSFGKGEYLFCYVAPERFQTEEFRNSLQKLTTGYKVGLVAIDEAHCVSEWGHDFRTSYLNIGRVAREYCRQGMYIPPLMALTGTASNSVLRDVQRELEIVDFDAIITPKTFDRKELHFSVMKCRSDQKKEIVSGIFTNYLPGKFSSTQGSFYQSRGDATCSGLLFCPHVNGDYGVKKFSEMLSQKLAMPVRLYSGSMPKGFENYDRWREYKRETARDFKNNKFPLMAVTKSFGMGIDKPNIRYTVHLGLPNSIEAFYQEVGRAGRDKNRAECVLILSNDDDKRASRLLDAQTEISEIEEAPKNRSGDDITRALWFHANSFKGIENEDETVGMIVEDIEDISIKSEHYFRMGLEGTTRNHSNNERMRVEKGIHRLLVLGIVEDYTIDYSSDEFHIRLSGIEKTEIIEKYAKYVASYNKGRVRKEVDRAKGKLNLDYDEFAKVMAHQLIEFIYDTVEKGRRRGLREMLTLAEAACESRNQDKSVRERVLRYLESTYSEEIDKVLNSEGYGFDQIVELIDGYETEDGEMIGGIRSPKDAEQIRGQVARYLESTPDHPGLLFLRSLSEMYCAGYQEEIVSQNTLSGMMYAMDRYGMDESEVYKTTTWILDLAHKRNPELYKHMIDFFAEEMPDSIEFFEFLIHDPGIQKDRLLKPYSWIMKKLCKTSVELIREMTE